MKNYPLEFILLNELHNSVVSKAQIECLFGRSFQLEKNIKRTMKTQGCKDVFGRVDFEQVKKKRKISIEKLEKAKQLLKKIEWMPWIRLIAVSGSVAFDNASLDDDIDIFIVTKKNRVWITRFFESIIFSFLKVRRRYGQVNVRDRLCFNYYIGEGFDNWSDRCNFITAVELVSLKPILGESYYKNMLRNNKWILEFFPGLSSDVELSKNSNHAGECSSWSSKIVDLVDVFLMKLQVFYMNSRGHKSESHKIDRNELCFYEEDWSAKNRNLEEALRDFISQ